MLRATSSGKLHTQEEAYLLADLGFTHVVNVDISKWNQEAAICHRAGLKLIARWPDWYGLDMLKEKYSFRNHEQASNAWGDSRVTGPSLWNPYAHEAAVASLPALVEAGVDGVLIHMTVCDRPYPLDWYDLGQRRWLKDYWCFDEYATQEWNDLDTGVMPHEAIPNDAHNRYFYTWYQGAWFRRLQAFTDAAVEVGMEDIWTWFIPLLSYSPQNMAGGMAGSDVGMEVWRRQVQSSGRVPVNVIATLWPLGDPRARTDTERLATDWDIIAGLETCGPRPFYDGRKNLELAANMGIGIFAGEKALLSNPEAARSLLCGS